MGKRNPHQDCNPVKIQSAEDALKNASLNELKTGGIVFATYVISSQLSRTGVANALVPTAEAIAKALGDDVCEAIVLKAGVQTAGMSSTKAAAKIIAKELMVDGVMLVVLTGADVVELFRGRISEEELLKNLTVTIISIGVGTAGGLSVWAAESLIAPYYESDAEEMFNMNTIAVISRSAAKTASIINPDGSIVSAFFCPLPVQAEGYDFPQNPSEKRAFPAERGGEDA